MIELSFKELSIVIFCTILLIAFVRLSVLLRDRLLAASVGFVSAAPGMRDDPKASATAWMICM